MIYEPIKTLEVENYGCIKNADFALTPLHALIGPNDSGKSTALRALRTAAQFGAGTFVHSDEHGFKRPFDPMLGRHHSGQESTKIALRYGDGIAYVIRTASGGVEEAVLHGPVSVVAQSQGLRGWNVRGVLYREDGPSQVGVLRSRITLPTMARFDPESMRAPTRLLPETEGIRFFDERGTGLAAAFDAIINRYSDARAKIEADVRARFPTVASVGLRNVSDSEKEISATLSNGLRIGAAEMSEGLLYYLAFAALRYVDGSRLILVEEPENGLHPSRIGEVMSVLREISKTGQVVIATHSPLVVNELEGHEVSVITRHPNEGTQVKLLKDVPGYSDAMKVYKPGEFWVSYADGKMEEPLLMGQPRT